VLSSDSKRTITIGLYSFLGKQNIQYGLLFAGFVIASIPIVLLFSLNMKNFIRGITAGGIKG
jgi:ABC-type glycerol-3-phosphate transport system permease component